MLLNSNRLTRPVRSPACPGVQKEKAKNEKQKNIKSEAKTEDLSISLSTAVHRPHRTTLSRLAVCVYKSAPSAFHHHHTQVTTANPMNQKRRPHGRPQHTTARQEAPCGIPGLITSKGTGSHATRKEAAARRTPSDCRTDTTRTTKPTEASMASRWLPPRQLQPAVAIRPRGESRVVRQGW